jgi:hypothetical protein
MTTLAIACFKNVPQEKLFFTREDAEEFIKRGERECGFQCSQWEIQEVE